MRNVLLASTMATALGLFTTQAHAADNGFYLGASVGQSSTEYDQNIEGTNFNYDASPQWP